MINHYRYVISFFFRRNLDKDSLLVVRVKRFRDAIDATKDGAKLLKIIVSGTISGFGSGLTL